MHKQLQKRVLLGLVLLCASAVVIRDQAHRALDRAVEQGDWKAVRRLMRFGFTIDSASDRSNVITAAATSGDYALLELALHRNTGALDAGKLQDALNNAITGSHDKCVLLLIDCGAPLSEIPTKSGTFGSPLAVAMRTHKAQLCGVLRSHGAHYTLYESAQYGDVEELKRNLDSGPKPTDFEETMRSLLATTAASGSADCVKALVSRGVPVNSYGGSVYFDGAMHRATPLMMAANSGSVPAIQALLNSGASVNARAKLRDLAARTSHPQSDPGAGATPLMLAAEGGYVQAVQLLLARGADAKSRTRDGTTALTADLKYVPPVSLKSPPQAADPRRGTGRPGVTVGGDNGRSTNDSVVSPDNLAVRIGTVTATPGLGMSRENHVDVARLLILAGADVHAYSTQTGNVLQTACRNGYAEVVEMLLSRGANSNLVTNKGYSALMCALNCEPPPPPFDSVVMEERSKLALMLLGHGADVNYQASDGMTALMVAALRNQPAAVRLLLNHHANAAAVSRTGHTFRELAISGSGGDPADARANMVSILHEQRGRLTLSEAARYGNIEDLKWHLDRGEDANTVIKLFAPAPPAVRKSSLLRPAVAVHIPTPLKAGTAGGPGTVSVGPIDAPPVSDGQVIASDRPSVFASPTARTTGTRTVVVSTVTVLSEAAASANAEAVRLLLDHGAKVDAVDSRGRTALMAAAENNRADSIRILVRRGANLEIRDKRSWTALMIACSSGRGDAVKALIDCGSALDSHDLHGWTALMRAACGNSVSVVRILIEHGANIHLANDVGNTVMEIAQANAGPEVVGALKDRDSAN